MLADHTTIWLQADSQLQNFNFRRTLGYVHIDEATPFIIEAKTAIRRYPREFAAWVKVMNSRPTSRWKP
jgi:hypothetical protein